MSPFWEHVFWIFVAMVCSGITAPLIVGYFQRKVAKKDIERENTLKARDDERERILKERDDARKALDTQWHESVNNFFVTMDKKISSFCGNNTKEHEELFIFKNKHEKQLESIETIHRQRGCDQPFQRRTYDHNT